MSENDYGKVIIGEPVPVTDGATNPLMAYDVEAQVVYGEQVYIHPPRPPPPPGVYGTYPPHPPHWQHPPPSERGEDCALFGCLLSWIPFVGIATYIVHCDAPPDSKRAYWSRIALIIGILILLLNILFWPIWYA